MKVSDLINLLEGIKKDNGDKDIAVTIGGSFSEYEIQKVDTSLIHPGVIIIDVKGY